MNETSGNNVSDSIASNNGTANGTTIVSGILGQARNFNESTDAIDVPDNSSLEGMSRITVSLWINPQAAFYPVIITKGHADNVTNPYFLRILTIPNNSKVEAVIGNGSSSSYVRGRTILSRGNFYHVAMTYDGTTLKVYVNGAEDGSVSANRGTLATNTSQLRMGSSLDGVYHFNGTIDEVGIWNKALSPAEISALYNGGSGLSL